MEVPKTFISHDAMIASVTAITTAYIAQHQISPDDLLVLVARLKSALCQGQAISILHPDTLVAPGNPDEPQPHGSIYDDYIVCLEDGRRFKSLKRHLKAKYNMTPEDYRKKWNLPPDYPMVSPAYAKTRSSIARAAGLGVTISRPSRKQTAAE